ncbi:MAG: EAL domain-containing protein [Liquorilactobacillus ghanensis]|uniref:EAL domain-containing protein n=1 Tax=Liquorilactobacillus ghanensis TaxID=399370 RepID=UPI0039E829F3
MDEIFEPHLNNLITSFSFELQPIINASNFKITDYEFLLRSKKSNRFPLNEFNLITQNDTNNTIYMQWLKKALVQELIKDPAKIISVNLDPQQLIYPSTHVFLSEMAKYHSQLTIEITEQKPLTTEQRPCFSNQLCQMEQLGYKLAFDDIGSGQNTLELLLHELEHFKRVKLSILKFQKLNTKLLAELLTFFHMLAQDEQLELVVEGIDCMEKAELALNHGICLQQGFWWRDLINNQQLTQLHNLGK